jgi:penicillin amidase
METINVAGSTAVTIPVFRTMHGPIADPMPFDPGNPAYVVAWKYSQWGKVLADMEPFLRLPPVQSMDAFAQQIAKLACSFHL